MTAIKLVPQDRKIVESVIEVLEDYLGKARRGDIDEVVVIARLARDHDATFRRSGFSSMSAMIGRIEMVKNHLLVNECDGFEVVAPPPEAS